MSKRAFLIPLGQALAVVTTVSCGSTGVYGDWTLVAIEDDGRAMSMYETYYANGVDYVTYRGGWMKVADDLTAEFFVEYAYSVGDREIYGDAISATLAGGAVEGSWRFVGDYGLDLDCSLYEDNELDCVGGIDGVPLALTFVR